jgi:hypothetical protein
MCFYCNDNIPYKHIIYNFIMKQTKLKILKKFIADNSDAPVQGTQSWLQGRMFMVGGSEISSIIGCNPFSSMEKLVAEKTGLTKFTGNHATRWGNLFENISELLFKTLFISHDFKDNTRKTDHHTNSKHNQDIITENQIYATGGIQHKTIQNHKYSPDGLCVLPFNGEYQITLLEFKSPFSSVPAGTVPKHYLPQVKAGLCTIDIAERAVFVNNMFRKCSLDQLDFGLDYDTRYHKDTDVKMRGIEFAAANGMILFYIRKSNIGLFQKYYNGFIDTKVNLVIGELPKDTSDDMSDVDSNGNDHVKVANVSNGDEFAIGYGSDISDDEPETMEETRQRIMCNDGTNIMYMIQDTTESKKLIDFGKMEGNLFNQFLELYKTDNQQSFLDIKCIKPQINRGLLQQKSKNFIIPCELGYVREPDYIDTVCREYNFAKIITKFTGRCETKGDIPIGYLPWKLMKGSNIMVERDPEYLNTHREKIDRVISIVKDINDAKSDLEKIKKFTTYFENTELGDSLYKDAAIKGGSLKEFCF